MRSKSKKFLIALLLTFTGCNNAEAQPLLILDQVAQTTELEKQGFTFSQILSNTSQTHNSALYQTPIYKSFVDTLSDDLDQIENGDKFLSVTMAKKHRLFDKRWFKSQNSFYELVGLITRLDRAPFSTDANHRCGEVRLIYRLAYQKKHRGEEMYSRLPVTLNMVFWLVDQSGQLQNCQAIAEKWNGEPLAIALKNKSQFQLQHLKSLEVNLQAVRWPSTVRPDFGGHAEYILRVFKYDSASKLLKPAPMENMLDVAKIKNNSALKEELAKHLTQPEVVKKFDQGIGVIPDKFLATEAISIAFHGIARLANRPFDQIFKDSDFKKINYDQTQFVKTPKAYLRRLNDMSCVGCHQSRAIAGFHFVGVDRENTFSANAVNMARSGHLQLDLIRREKYFKSLLGAKIPDDKRGFSERLESEKGRYGAHCSMGVDPSFAQWTCDPDLKCQSIDSAVTNDIIGVCLPEKNKYAGDPCDVGRVSQHSDPRKDRIINKTARACRADQYCFQAGDGFPGGLCHNFCEKIGKGESCGLIAFNGFNPCLAQNKPFTTCLKEFTGDISLKACDTNTPCRDDFVCARSKNNSGVCIPPYFLFQLRADGHPSP